MDFDRPDLRTLIDRVTTDLNARFEGIYNAVRRRVLAVFARVLAGLANGIYGYIDWVSQQILPDTMDEQRLRRFGAAFNVPYAEAVAATGSVVFTGVDDSVIPSGTALQRDDGTEYVTTAEATIAAGTVTVAVAAVVAGAAGNTDEAAAIHLVSPVDGVQPSGVVAAGGLAAGADAEQVEAYRLRVLQRTGRYYTGANRAIYEQWALEVPGVTRVWAYEATPAAGSVTVLFVCDGQGDGDAILPDAAMVETVEDYLEEHVDPATGDTVGRAVNVTLVVDGPVADTLNFTILPSPNTSAVRTAIAAELADLLRREAEPGGTILLSHIREAISLAAGENDYTLTAPAANVTSSAGEIAVMGTITWE